MKKEIKINTLLAYGYPGFRYDFTYNFFGYKELPVVLTTFEGAVGVDFEESIERITSEMVAPSHDQTNSAPNEFVVQYLKSEGVAHSNLEMALIQFPFNMDREEVIKLVHVIDTENPWRCAGISALCFFAQMCKEKHLETRGAIALNSVARIPNGGDWSPIISIKGDRVEISEIHVGYGYFLGLGNVDSEIHQTWCYLIVREAK